jgi:hypothetical protein
MAMEDDGITIAQALKNKAAIAVSDGSFKDSYGTAAWVVEGLNSYGRMMGQVITPGGPSDHSSYRSELSGIYSILVVVNQLCAHYKIVDGEIELACDGLSAINKAFSAVSILNIDDSNYDLLGAIQHQWKNSPVHWKFRHVKGHQDDHSSFDTLDRWSKLNVEMDHLAKEFLATAKRRPRHYLIKDEPWSVWIGPKKISKDLSSTIYDIVHATEAKDYWLSKDRVPHDTYDSNNWDALHKAMEESPRPRRIFIMKHSAGMCGVGKFMHRWKERDNPNCPRCGQFEDAPHVWLCKGCDTNSVWTSSLDKPQDWMTSVQTDPDIQDAIINYLDSWRNDTTPPNPPPHIDDLLQAQTTLGWRTFFEGWIPVSWEDTYITTWFDRDEQAEDGLSLS